jgi:hemerythrin
LPTNKRLKQSAKYPDFAAHKAAHEELTRQVLQFQEDFRAGRVAAIGISLLQFLKTWLEKHIQETDRRYSARTRNLRLRNSLQRRFAQPRLLD